MEQNTEGLVTIVGNSYLFSIADLSETLFSRSSLSQNDVQASSWENGYSASLCILAVAWFESYTMRVRYLSRTSPHATMRHPIRFLKALHSDLSFCDDLMEVFVLRDALVHNHLWMIQFSWDETGGMELHEAQKDELSGDVKYEQYVDLKTRKTRRLFLNVVPTRVCNVDFKTVLKTIWNGLLFIQRKDPDHLCVENCCVEFRGQVVSTQQFVDQICI